MSKERRYYVYLLINKYNTVNYTGVTNDLIRRVHEHKTKFNKGFSQRYNINRLVYFEEFCDISDAILREKEIKKWGRRKKMALIKKENPSLRDLFRDIISY